MRCPFCGHLESRVLDTRSLEGGVAIRRRRECLACARRFTTYERAEERPLFVIKKDGRREQFDRGKILAGLRKACEKRPIPATVLEDLVERIEYELRARGMREVPTREIGERLMEELRRLDEVAYVRFASVYREFKDLETFHRELETLRSGRAPEEITEGRNSDWPNAKKN
ncbi:MAG: transcriptional repressor NrdR [Firmicutes bacterium]|nr:transcriptional repressor NrdR [Bacillota bacterium]